MTINYCHDTALKPSEFGRAIGILINKKVITGNERFVHYIDYVCVDENKKPIPDKHNCLLYFLPNDEDVQNLMTLSSLAGFCLTDEHTQKECGIDEGLGAIEDTKIHTKYMSDKRLKFILIDWQYVKKYISECKPISEIIKSIQYDNVLGCYCFTVRMNKNSIEQLNQIQNDGWKKQESNYIDRLIVSFVKQYCPNEINNLQYYKAILDLGKTIYDEEDGVERQYMKYVFSLIKDNKPFIIDNYENTITCQVQDPNNLKYHDILNILTYYKETHQLFDDDSILVILSGDDKACIIKKRSNAKLTDEQEHIFGQYCIVKNILDDLSKSELNQKFESIAFSDKIESYIQTLTQDEFNSLFEILPLIPQPLHLDKELNKI